MFIEQYNYPDYVWRKEITFRRTFRYPKEQGYLFDVWEKLLNHLPEKEFWPVVKAEIDAGTRRNFPHMLARLVLITSIHGISEDNRAYVVQALLSCRWLYKVTLEDISKFAPLEEQRLEATDRLSTGKKLRGGRRYDPKAHLY